MFHEAICPDVSTNGNWAVGAAGQSRRMASHADRASLHQCCGNFVSLCQAIPAPFTHIPFCAHLARRLVRLFGIKIHTLNCRFSSVVQIGLLGRHYGLRSTCNKSQRRIILSGSPPTPFKTINSATKIVKLFAAMMVVISCRSSWAPQSSTQTGIIWIPSTTLSGFFLSSPGQWLPPGSCRSCDLGQSRAPNVRVASVMVPRIPVSSRDLLAEQIYL